MKRHILALISDIEKQNEELKRGNDQLKHILYHKKFIDNPLLPEERMD